MYITRPGVDIRWGIISVCITDKSSQDWDIFIRILIFELPDTLQGN